MEHYAQVTEADIREAAETAIIKGAENVVHNRVHPIAKSGCNGVQEEKQSIDITP